MNVAIEVATKFLLSSACAMQFLAVTAFTNMD